MRKRYKKLENQEPSERWLCQNGTPSNMQDFFKENWRFGLKINFLAFSISMVKNGSTTLDRKRIYANPSSYPNPSPNTNPNPSPYPKAQLCFRTDEMTSFFDQVYRYR